MPAKTWVNNVLFCALAGVLWYSQFFGLGMGKSFFTSSPLMTAFSWSILMSLNVLFSNLWGIWLHEWRGVDRRTAADFSFLLSIPSIIGGAVLEIPGALREGAGEIDWLCVAAGMLVAGVTGYLAIRWMLAAIKRRSLWGFAVYVGLLGTAILVDQFFTHIFF